MKLKQLKIKNVKSFRDETVFDFHDDFNILIGTNGGGKSNLLDIVTIGLKYFLFNSAIKFLSQKTTVTLFSCKDRKARIFSEYLLTLPRRVLFTFVC